MIKKVATGVLCLLLLGGCSHSLSQTSGTPERFEISDMQEGPEPSEISENVIAVQQEIVYADPREDLELFIKELKQRNPSTFKSPKTSTQSTWQEPVIITPEKAIKTAISKLPKDTKLYVSIHDLQTGESHGHNTSARVFPASTIKVLYAAVYYSCLEAGKFDLDAIHTLKKTDKYSRGKQVRGTGVLQNQPNGKKLTHRELLSHMITDSDNVATNIMTRIIGFNTIMKKAREWGLTNTSCQREMYDGSSSLRQNTTTMKDLTKLLSLIGSGKIISTKNRSYLLEDMMAVEKDRLGKYAPTDVIVANKTGEVTSTRADIGIVFFKNRKPLVISALIKRDNGKPVSVSTVEKVIGTMTKNLIDYYKPKL